MSYHAQHLEYALKHWRTFLYLIKVGDIKEYDPEPAALLALVED